MGLTQYYYIHDPLKSQQLIFYLVEMIICGCRLQPLDLNLTVELFKLKENTSTGNYDNIKTGQK